MPSDQVRLILQLRLLIARAANRDSLAWWDDDSFTAPAGFVLERTFPFAPPLAARSLALRAAWERHLAALPQAPSVLHLYRLDSDGQDKLAVRKTHLLDIPVRSEPITSIGELRDEVMSLIGDPPTYRVGHLSSSRAMHIQAPPPRPGDAPLMHRAKVLAAAYLAGEPGRAVFPYLMAE